MTDLEEQSEGNAPPKSERQTAQSSSGEKNYLDQINSSLRPKVDETLPHVVDLFAGCGGLSLGFEALGFPTTGFEKDESCCATYNANLNGTCGVTELSVDSELPSCNVLIGGPPCQPFSVGGKQLGLEDSRDGLPIFISAISRLQPEIALFENVRGMFYRNKWYLHQVIEAIENLGYIVEMRLLNAKRYGVPQNRERVIVVAHRGDFKYPQERESNVTAGEALGNLAFQVDEKTRFVKPNMDVYIAKYEKASKCINPRDLHLDRPARTLTCRNLAGATGDMHRIRLQDGRRKRLNHREAARLQSFPDWFNFVGTETERFYQIGNAVAPLFAMALAKSVKNYFENGGAYLSSLEVQERILCARQIEASGQMKLFGQSNG